MQLDSIRVIAIGAFGMATQNDIVDVYYKCDPFLHRLSREAANNQDRQNVGTCVERASLNVSKCLLDRGHTATRLVYAMHRRYILVFYGKKISMYDRVVCIGYILHFMRLQRLFVSICTTTNLTSHTWTY